MLIFPQKSLPWVPSSFQLLFAELPPSCWRDIGHSLLFFWRSLLCFNSNWHEIAQRCWAVCVTENAELGPLDAFQLWETWGDGGYRRIADAERAESCDFSSIYNNTSSYDNSPISGHCSELKTESCGSFLMKEVTEFLGFYHHLLFVRSNVRFLAACGWVRSAQGPLSPSAAKCRFTLKLDSLVACTVNSNTRLNLRGTE